MYFMIGAFLQPKIVLNIFEINKSLVVESISNERKNIEIVKKIYSLIKNCSNELPQLPNQDEVEAVVTLIDNSFLGHLKKKSLEMKKIRVLEIYRYLYRFSYFRTQKMIDNPIMMLVIFQYLLDTKMRRIHERSVLSKNHKAYYRCCENLINLSRLN